MLSGTAAKLIMTNERNLLWFMPNAVNFLRSSMIQNLIDKIMCNQNCGTVAKLIMTNE